MAPLRLSILLLIASVCMMAKAQQPSEESKPQDECEENCQDASDPVCAVGKIEYENQCYACCASQRDESVKIASLNACRPEDPDNADEKACTREFDPYCGSDGTEYGNRCVYENAVRENPCLMARKCSDPTDK